MIPRRAPASPPIIALALLLCLASCAPPATGPSTGTGPSMPASGPSGSLDLVAQDVATLRSLLAAGTLSAERLTAAYLQRVAELDRTGARLNAIIEINPDALSTAADLDAHLAAHGVKGPLHGLPVVLKASIDTGDETATSAGSLALADHVAREDAFLVTRLRDAGAVILGKANMSEWANFRSTRSSSGWSSLGGQVRNPYVLDRSPCGSSSGSAVAVSASLSTLAVGTETDGSIVCPAGVNGVVGIKPTLGTVSRRGIIPIAPSQDTAGPMAKTVMGAALLLAVMAAHDPADPSAKAFPEGAGSLIPDAGDTSLSGKRIGVLRTYHGAGTFPRIESIFTSAVTALTELGAEIIDPIEVDADASALADSEMLVLMSEFKVYLDEYLAAHPVDEDRNSLDKLIEFNAQNRDRVMPIFGQEIFEAATRTEGLRSSAYLEALKASNESMGRALAKVFDDHALDALVAPTNGPAWKIDWIAGDRYDLSSSSFAAISGYPSVTVPAGSISGLPIGLSFVGEPLSEPSLIQIAYAFEQATRARTVPAFIPTIESR